MIDWYKNRKLFKNNYGLLWHIKYILPLQVHLCIIMYVFWLRKCSFRLHYISILSLLTGSDRNFVLLLGTRAPADYNLFYVHHILINSMVHHQSTFFFKFLVLGCTPNQYHKLQSIPMYLTLLALSLFSNILQKLPKIFFEKSNKKNIKNQRKFTAK